MDIKKLRLSQGEVPDHGIWAAAARQDGQYGIALGQGQEVVKFLPEALLTLDFLKSLRSVSAVQAELCERAMRNLPRLKADVRFREARHGAN
jgi:hypothetical protein